jgi:hypothetical protein
MEPKTIYAKELMERWKMNDVDFVNFVADHFSQMHYPDWDLIRPEVLEEVLEFDPDARSKTQEVLKRVGKDSGIQPYENVGMFSIGFEFWISNKPLIRKNLHIFYFYLDNVERFEELNPDVSVKKEVQVKEEHEIQGKHPQEEIKPQYAFVNQGSTWGIVFDGQSLTGVNGKGFYVIQYLMGHPNKRFSANDLYDVFELSPEAISKERGIFENNLTHTDDDNMDYDQTNMLERVRSSLNDDCDHTGYENDKETLDIDAIADSRAIKQYKKRYAELKSLLEDAKDRRDEDDQEKIENEMELIEKWGLNLQMKGHPRKFRDENDSVKDKYAQQIRRAIEQIQKYDETEGKVIWEHFNSAFSPFTDFCYRSSNDLDWVLQ